MRKIGGLYHWRIGRLGGSVYIARLTAANSREDYLLARLATANFTIGGAAWIAILLG